MSAGTFTQGPWWVVVDDQGLPDFITLTEGMAHDHIKELQDQFLDEPAHLAAISRYTVRPVVLQQPAPLAVTAGKSLLRAPLKPGERLVCYCPPGVCQAPRGFSGPCNRAPSEGRA